MGSRDAVAVYAARSVAGGLDPLASEEVSGEAPWPLYCALASAVLVLEDQHDRRVAMFALDLRCPAIAGLR